MADEQTEETVTEEAESTGESQEQKSGELVESDKTNSNEKDKINPEVLQGIPVTISVEVGRTSLKIRDLLRLSQGSVVELERLAGEPLDLLVNNTVVAQGEIVLVNDRYGIRLTRVVPAEERMKTI